MTEENESLGRSLDSSTRSEGGGDIIILCCLTKELTHYSESFFLNGEQNKYASSGFLDFTVQ